jgi:uncharacterized Zn finger protein
MTTDLTIANILAHMDYEFEANPYLMIYVICNRCGHDRFEIRDSRQEIGPSGLTVYSLWIAQCMNCGTIHEINISKMQVSE